MKKLVGFRQVKGLAILCSLLPWLAAQSASQAPSSVTPTHIRYKLIDLGTLGGPNSAETLEFPFINNRGMVVGFADTATPDPTNPGGFLPHAFRWQHYSRRLLFIWLGDRNAWIHMGEGRHAGSRYPGWRGHVAPGHQ